MRQERSRLWNENYTLSQRNQQFNTSSDTRCAETCAWRCKDTTANVAGTRPSDPCPQSPRENGKCAEVISRWSEIHAITWEISNYSSSGNRYFLLGHGWGGFHDSIPDWQKNIGKDRGQTARDPWKVSAHPKPEPHWGKKIMLMKIYYRFLGSC